MPRRPIADIRTMNTLFTAAEAAARRAGENLPGAEHLLLATLDLAEGSARRVFERVGADADAFQGAISGQHAEALRAVGIEPIDDSLEGGIPPPGRARGPLRTSASAQRMFKRVVKLIRKEKSQLYGAYFVLVAAQTEQGTVARALRHMGIDPETLAAAARAEVDALNRAG